MNAAPSCWMADLLLESAVGGMCDRKHIQKPGTTQWTKQCRQQLICRTDRCLGAGHWQGMAAIQEAGGVFLHPSKVSRSGECTPEACLGA